MIEFITGDQNSFLLDAVPRSQAFNISLKRTDRARVNGGNLYHRIKESGRLDRFEHYRPSPASPTLEAGVEITLPDLELADSKN